jgi:hypothetical protein
MSAMVLRVTDRFYSDQFREEQCDRDDKRGRLFME